MAKRYDVIRDQLGELRKDLEALWVALSADPKKQARRERAWSLFSGVLVAAATMAARRSTAKAWAVLTGEQPPSSRPARGPTAPAQPPG
jgi:hypothetical protein